MTTASLSTLRDLKLGGMASAYEAVLATPLDQQPEAHELIARLVDAERQNRQRQRMELNLRLSKLRYERAGTIIVSQLPVGKWHEYIAEPTIL
jgi:hypothetical protein